MSSESFVNQITLQFLVNKKQYGKYLQNKVAKENEEDKTKYNEQFLSLVNNLLQNNDECQDLPTDVKLAYENLFKTCVHHFKHLEEMKNYSETNSSGNDGDNEENSGSFDEEDEEDDEEEDVENEDEEEDYEKYY